MPEILLTGGSGFLGRALLRHPSFHGALVVGRTLPGPGVKFSPISLDASSDYNHVLSGPDERR